MRIKLIFSDEFKIQNCWFGLDTEKILTVGDLIKDLSTACGVGSISLEMDGFLLLDDGEISVLLRDGDLLIVQSSGKNLNKKRKRPIEEISTDRSLAVNIRPDLDSADDASSIDEQNNNLTLVQGNPKNQNSESKSSKVIEEIEAKSDGIIQPKQLVIASLNEDTDSGSDLGSPLEDNLGFHLENNLGGANAESHAASHLEDGEIIPLVMENDMISEKVKSENDEELMVPIPVFLDEELVENFAPSYSKMKTISYSRETKYRIDGFRGKGIMHFEEIQKNGWMEDAGNTMDWKPPETTKGWNVDSSKSIEFENRKDSKWGEIDKSNHPRKSRFDSETFNRDPVESSQDRDKQSTGEGYVEFSNLNQAKRACKLDGQVYVKGSKLRIELVSKPPLDPTPENLESKEAVDKSKTNLAEQPQQSGYCKITGLCKPIKISIFHSFLLKSGGKVALSNDSNDVIISFKSHSDMEKMMRDYSGKSLVGTNPKSRSHFQVISENEFVSLKEAFNKIIFCV